MKLNYLPRKKRRLREIEFERVEEIQREMKINNIQMSELLGLYTGVDGKGNKTGSAQYYNYRKCGRLPADKYFGARDSLLLSIHEDTREQIDRVMRLFA